MPNNELAPEGLRERKRRETLGRIADEAITLFAAHGYEATTLDAIADAAGIARRTIFHYFKSKEEIVLAWQAGMPDAVRAAISAQSTEQSPLDVLHVALLELTRQFGSRQSVTIDRILRSTERLRAGNHAKFLLVEDAAWEALQGLWPTPELRGDLRMAAMVAVGALRLAVDSWAEEGGSKPLSTYFSEVLTGIRRQV